MTRRGTYLGLDLGERHIGVAVRPADTEVVLARPSLHVDDTDEARRVVLAYLEKERPDAVVVGLPVTMRGDIGPQAARVEAFVESLRPDTSCPIHLVDERLTSQLPSMDDGLDDHGRAAQNILETWLSQPAS